MAPCRKPAGPILQVGAVRGRPIWQRDCASPPAAAAAGAVHLRGLINELAEAAHANQLSRALARWERLDLICIDELGYVPLAETACELMFQVIADRAEKAAVIVTTNLPFCCGSAGAASTTNRSPCRKVWAMDVTYIPMARGFVYLAAVVDWFSRRVLAWRVSISMEVDFCLEAVEEALARHGKPSIFNTDHARERIVKMQRVDPPHNRQLGLVSSPILA